MAVLSAFDISALLAQSPQQFPPGPTYRIQASVDLVARVLRGSASIEWIADRPSADRICLRLDDATLTLRSASLSTAATNNFDLLADAQVSAIAGSETRRAVVSRAVALEPGQIARVQVSWERRVPAPDRIGAGESVVLAGWFPKLATDCHVDRRELRVPASTLHAVVTVPRDWTVVSGGTESAVADGADLQRYDLEIENASELAWAATRGLEISRDRFEPAGAPPVTLRTVLAPGSAERTARIMAAAKDTLGVLAQWYGRYPSSQLTVVDVAWNSPDAHATFPGLMGTAPRWLSTSRDVSLERAIVAGVNRQFWFAAADQTSDTAWFAEGVARYAGARAFNEVLEGRDYPTLRFFGDAVPYTIRSILLSRAASDPRPRVSGFDELAEPTPPARASSSTTDDQSQRAARAMDTLERYVGWPAMREVLAAGQENPAILTPSGFAARLGAARGTDLSWFFADAFRLSVRFDYAIDVFQSDSLPGAQRYRTTLSLRRHGDAVFAGTNGPLAEGAPAARSLPVAVQFADGNEVRDWWDGREPTMALEYESASRAVRAVVDPEVTLLLDADRRNNVRTLVPRLPPLGLRLLLGWMVWLEDAILTYSGVL